MNETDIIEKKPIVLPCIAGLLWILSVFFIGLAAPVFVQMFKDFGIDPLPFNMQIISRIHWCWTLPLGIIVAAGLIWSSRHWSRKTTLRVATAAIVMAILVFVAFILGLQFPGGIHEVK